MTDPQQHGQVPEYGAYANQPAPQNPQADARPGSGAQPGAPQPNVPQYAQPAPAAAPEDRYAQQPAAGAPGVPQYAAQTAQTAQTTPDAPGAWTTPQPNPATPQYGQYAQQPAGAHGWQQPADPYGQAPQYGAPLPQGVPGYAPGDPSVGVPTIDRPYYRCPFGTAIARFFQKYLVFTGRASKSEFWWIILFFVLCGIALSILSSALSFVSDDMPTILSTLWTLATIVPFIALGIRRLHDTNKSGWWLLLPGIPYVITQILDIVVLSRAIDDLGALAFIGANGDAEMMTRQIVEAAQFYVVPGIIGTVCGLVYLISGLVLMLGATNPAGARFDR